MTILKRSFSIELRKNYSRVGMPMLFRFWALLTLTVGFLSSGRIIWLGGRSDSFVKKPGIQLRPLLSVFVSLDLASLEDFGVSSRSACWNGRAPSSSIFMSITLKVAKTITRSDRFKDRNASLFLPFENYLLTYRHSMCSIHILQFIMSEMDGRRMYDGRTVSGCQQLQFIINRASICYLRSPLRWAGGRRRSCRRARRRARCPAWWCWAAGSPSPERCSVTGNMACIHWSSEGH